MNPNWTIEAAAEQQRGEENVPVQYLSGYAQLKLNKLRAAQMAAAQ